MHRLRPEVSLLGLVDMYTRVFIKLPSHGSPHTVSKTGRAGQDRLGRS